MNKIETEIGDIYVLRRTHNAAEHSFTHYANMAENDRNLGDQLWLIDIYTVDDGHATSHDERRYIWAKNKKIAARNAMQYVNDEKMTVITNIKPLEDKLLEPATF